MASGFNDLPSWAKGVIAVLATGTVVVGGYYLIKAIDKRAKLATSGTDKAQSEEVDDTKQELDALNQSSSTKQKLTGSEALSIANTIDQAMQGLGTDEQTIKDQFYKLNNNADFLAVQKAWGKRLIKSGSILFVEDIKLTFVPALRNELNSYWVGLINKVLKAKGIKYRV